MFNFYKAPHPRMFNFHKALSPPSFRENKTLAEISKITVDGTDLGDNCIQNFQFGRYIIGYTVENLVLRRRASGAEKRFFPNVYRMIYLHE